ncbi:MAG: glycosyltransferase family 4 protein [Vulcanimicrobiaceae bacterium]
MKLLILNWRDVWHPKSGGAELVTLRVAERLVRWGWSVEWFSASYPGAAATELRDGIRYVRRGNQATVHLAAWLHYRNTSLFDIVVDEVNTIPFYARAYIRAPVLAYFQQLAREVWTYETPWPIGIFGARAERFYLRPYRAQPTVSISKSSIESLTEIGLSGPFSIFPMSVDEVGDAERPLKTSPRDIVVLGRVTPSKRIEHSIEAAASLARIGWDGRLFVVGRGDPKYVASLKRLADRRLADRIHFTGRVSDEARGRLLRSASCLWMTSVREGWGLAVTEAARHWTPAVVYDVPGLRDSVVDGRTGSVVAPRPEALASATAKLFDSCFDERSRGAREDSIARSWDRCAREFETILQRTIDSAPDSWRVRRR